MPGRVTFKANRAGITALATGPKARAAVTAVAEKGKGIAQGLSEEFRQSGHYADSFQVHETTVRINGLPRAAARLENTADYATVVEIGRKGKEGHHVLSRTLDGLRDG